MLLNDVDGTGCPPLILTLQLGNDDLCNYLLDKGADVNIQEERSNRTALHYALYMKKHEIFEKILSLNPNLELTDYKKTTIIHRASSVRDIKYLKSIFDKMPPSGILLNMADCDGANAVMLACQNGNIEHLKLLCEHGATVSAVDKCGRTALHHCVENANTDCADFLLKNDTSLLNTADNEGLTPLHMSAITGNEALLHLLLKKGANLTCLDEEKHTVVHWATVSGQTEILDLLIEHGADVSVPDRHNAFPIHYAAQMSGRRSRTPTDSSRGTILKQLLDHKVDMTVRDKDGRQPLLWAASSGNVEACQTLVAAGADIEAKDKDGLTALHCAASRGHTAVIEELVTHCQANIDAVDKNNCTPLLYAITLGNIECVKMLIQLGANTSHCDKRGRSPAHCAAIQGSQETLVLLQRKNVDLWCPSNQGDFPIHEAALGGHEGIVKFFLGLRNRSEVVHLSNCDGRNCLHIAALTDNLTLCQLLLDSGADINAIMRSKGKYYTAVDIANLKGHRETEQYLISKGGKTGDFVTNDAASIIQRNYKLKRELLRRRSAKGRRRSQRLTSANTNDTVSSKNEEDVRNEKSSDREEKNDENEETEIPKNQVKVVISLADQKQESPDELDNTSKSVTIQEQSGKDSVKGSQNMGLHTSKQHSSVTFENSRKEQTSSHGARNSSIKEGHQQIHSKSATVQTGHDKHSETTAENKNTQPGPQNKNKRVLHRSRKARRDLAMEVQASVRRFEVERQAVREYHQLKRAQMYTRPIYDFDLVNQSVQKSHNSDLHSSQTQSCTDTEHNTVSNDTENEESTNSDEHIAELNHLEKQKESKKHSQMSKKDKQMERTVAQNEDLVNNLNKRTSSTLDRAKTNNNKLQESITNEKQDKKYKTTAKEKSQKQRNIKYYDWRKQRAEELEQRLSKAYKQCYINPPLSRGSSRGKRSNSPSSSPSRPPTTQSYHSMPASLPHYAESTYSHRMRAASANPASYTTIMTRHGLCRMRLQPDPVGQ